MEQKLTQQQGELLLKRDQSICIIELNAHSTKNAISLAMAATMGELISSNPITQKSYLEEFILQNKLDILVVRSGVSGVFCSGGDLRDLSKEEGPEHKSYGNNVRRFCQLDPAILLRQQQQ